MKRKIGIINGSLRKHSFNGAVADAVAKHFPEDYEILHIQIGDLPYYNEDLENEENIPAEWTRFREEIRSCDAFILATPEYNRAISPAIKNALDVGSRPYGENSWADKPALVTSASPGGIGGFGANHQLRQCLVFLDVPVVQQPEVYVGGVANLVDEEGKISNEETLAFLGTAADALVEYIERFENE